MTKFIVKNAGSESISASIGQKLNSIEKFLKKKPRSAEEEYVKMVVEYMILTPKKKEYRKPYMDQFKIATRIAGGRGMFEIVSINKYTTNVTMRSTLVPTQVERAYFSEILPYLREYIG
jgi:hypothetical protein